MICTGLRNTKAIERYGISQGRKEARRLTHQLGSLPRSKLTGVGIGESAP